MIIKKYLNKLTIHPYTLILIFLALITGLFKEIISILIIVIIHELGHFILMNKYKWNIKKITIYPFGGVTSLDDNIDKPLFEELIITLMGPIFQIILFIASCILYKYHIINFNFYKIFNNYNISILIFNLLPIAPLDGFKILNVFFNRILNFRLSYTINLILSSIVLTIFCIIFGNDSSYFLIIIYLIYQLIHLYKNRYLFFNRFILEKRLRKSNYIKYKKVNNVKKMYRNKRNLINDNGTYITEYKYINKSR